MQFMFRRGLLLLAGFALLFGGCLSPLDQGIEAVQLGGLKKLHRVGSYYLGSQPSEADLQLLGDLGIRKVINLRHASEQAGFDERALVERQGMQYDHIPFNGEEELTDALIDSVSRSLDNSEGPVFLHCASSNRVGAVWLAYRVKEQGIDFGEALEEARLAGLRSQSYIRRVQDYVDRQ